jgi:hypothetical protein
VLSKIDVLYPEAFTASQTLCAHMEGALQAAASLTSEKSSLMSACGEIAAHGDAGKD